MNQVQVDIQNEKRFLHLAAASAFATVITTIAIHQISYPAGSFEQSLQLYQNKAYLAQNWIILLHCLLVLVSMLGVALMIRRMSTPLAIFGLLFFALFVFTEWERTLGNLWHLNGLRKRYIATTDVEALQFLRYELQYRLSQSNVQFLLFTLGISLGNASYGMALIGGNKLDRLLGAGLLLWAGCTSIAFVVDFYPAQWMDKIVQACNKIYQPLIRFAIGYWMLKTIQGEGSGRRRDEKVLYRHPFKRSGGT